MTIKLSKSISLSIINMFEILYCVNLLFMLLVRVQGSGILSKFRYIYIACLVLLTIYFIYQNVISDDVFCIAALIKLMLPFILHTFLFCCIFTNDSIIASTNLYLQELLIFISSLIFTAYFTVKFGLFDEIIRLTYWCFAIFLFYCYITNFNGLEPFRYLTTLFNSTGRVRYSFGFNNAVEVGMYAEATLTLSIYMLIIKKELSFKHLKIDVLIQIILDAVMVLIILSSATRGAIIELVFFVLLVVFHFLRKHIILKANKKAVFLFCTIALFVLFVFFFAFEGYVYLWELSSSRMDNYTINLEIFEQYANKLYGMGYASHSTFQNKGYGYDTFALDVMYLYFYFSTGIVGFAIIMWQLIVLFINIYRTSVTNDEKKFFIRTIFLIMLFDGFFEVSFFNPVMVNCYIYMLLIIAYCAESKVKQLKSKKKINFRMRNRIYN